MPRQYVLPEDAVKRLLHAAKVIGVVRSRILNGDCGPHEATELQAASDEIQKTLASLVEADAS